MENDLDILAARSISGDKEAMGRLMSATYALVKGIVGSLKNRQDREDVTQEFMLRLTKKLHLYKIGSRYANWVRTIARNCVIEQFRRGRRARLLALSYRPDLDDIIATINCSDDLDHALLYLSSRLAPREFVVVLGQSLSPPVPDSLLAIWFGRTQEAIRGWRMLAKDRLAQDDFTVDCVARTRCKTPNSSPRAEFRRAHEYFLENLAFLWFCSDQWEVPEFEDYVGHLRIASMRPLRVTLDWSTRMSLTLSKSYSEIGFNLEVGFNWNPGEQCLSSYGNGHFFAPDLVRCIGRRRPLPLRGAARMTCTCALCLMMYSGSD